MSFPNGSQAYYENSFLKFSTKPEKKNDETNSNLSFSDENEKKDKKTKKNSQKTQNSSNKKTVPDSPFASLFEINPSNQLKRTKNSSEEFSFTQQPNYSSTQFSNFNSKEFSLPSEKENPHLYKTPIKKPDFYFSQIPDSNVFSDGLMKTMSNSNDMNSSSVEQFKSIKGSKPNVVSREYFKKNFEKKPSSMNNVLPSKNDENKEILLQKDNQQKIEKKESMFLEENPSENVNKTTIPQKEFQHQILNNTEINKTQSHSIESQLEKIHISESKFKESQHHGHEIEIMSREIQSTPKTSNINDRIQIKSDDLASNTNIIKDAKDVNTNTSLNNKNPIFNPPKYNVLSTVHVQTDDQGPKVKSFLDIFKSRIDQKKVGEISNLAKQKTLVSISQQAVPNKKYVAKYMENFIKKNKLDQKTQENTEDFKKLNKLFFEEERPFLKNEPKKRIRKKKPCLFEQEEPKNSDDEESVSDIDQESSCEDDKMKSNLDIDFEQFFEEDLGKLLNKKNFKKKGKIAKKLDIKANRIRIKKEKQVKEYLLETRFTYSSKPLKWRKLPETKNKSEPSEYRLPDIEHFIGQTGIKIPSLLNTIKPYDFFLQFMPESIFEEVARLTNISASLEFYAAAANKNREWKEVTPLDIKKWFGLLFLFGIVRKYSVNEYWTTDPLLGLNSVNKIMNKGRFNDLRKYMSFYDKRKKADYEKVYPPLDPFYKFRFLLDHINEICRKAYIPERELSVDESMISYQGVHRLKVYMPRKPTKWGFKAFVLSESSSGYVCNMILNEGHQRGENEDLLSKRIVLQILHGYEHMGFRIYMDRWYTSSDLLSEMRKRGFGGCGTIFLSRVGLINDLKKEVREFKDPGEARFYTNNEMIFVAWYQYRRQVYVLSNFHNADWMKVEKIRKISYFCKKEYKIYDYDSPRMIKEYNIYMGGVDLFNQRVSYYNVDYDIMKWYMRLVFWIFEIAMVNSYLLYCKVMNAKKLKPIPSSEYRMEVIRNLTLWDNDPTKTVYRKGITDQPLDKNIDDEKEFDREFHNLNAKRKHKDNLEIKTFTELKLEIKCKLEYIGVGICHLCKKNRKKLKKTDFWCKSCQKGVCLTCFDTHRVKVIFKKMSRNKESNHLITHMISKKKLKIEQHTEFYETHMKKDTQQKKPETKLTEPDLHKNNENNIILENEARNNNEINQPNENLIQQKENMNNNVILVNDESSSSSSEESIIMEVRKKPNEKIKANFDNYLKKQETTKIVEEIKKDREQYKNLKASLDNFFSINEKNDQMELENNEEKRMSQINIESTEKCDKEPSNEQMALENIQNSARKELEEEEIAKENPHINPKESPLKNVGLRMESLEITDKSESNLLDQTASKIKTIDKGNEKILLIGNQNFKIPHSHEKTENHSIISKAFTKDKSISSKFENMMEKEKQKDIRLIGRHFPTTNPQGRQVNCEFCKKNNSRRTIGYCAKCQVALCPLYCFEKYHTEATLE